MLKKGAMFGLDARIALAIFGALSVISGAALYSAIGNAKATALLTDMTEVGKAWEAYYLDTGQNLPSLSNDISTSKYSMLKSHNLVVDEGIVGWQGPYLPYASTGDHLEYNLYNRLYIYRLDSSDDWGGSVDWSTGNARCTNGENCFIWIHSNKIESEALVKAIDKKVDSSDGPIKGRFKWYNVNDQYKYQIWLRYAPIKNPNN